MRPFKVSHSLLVFFLLTPSILCMTSAEQNRLADGTYREKVGKGPLVVRKMWPDTVGLTAEEATKRITAEMPAMLIVVVPTNTSVTTEYNPHRVRLFVNDASIVVRVPMIG